MESRSSESNYDFGGYSGRSYGGFSSESSYSSESRDSYRPTPSSFSSESSYSSESRDTYSPTPSFSSESALESRNISTPTYGTPSTNQNNKKYNSLDDIDKLIERMESSTQNVNVTSDRANQILTQRKQKIEKLKNLVADARKAEAEERMIKQLEQENNELDNAIDSLNRGFHR